MSPSGQTEKNSVRAYVFRFASEFGHCSTQSACLKGASNGLDRAPQETASLSRPLPGTSASKTLIVGIGKVIGIASASLAGSRSLPLRIAREAAVRPAFIIVHAVVQRGCDGPAHPCGRSW